MEQLRTLEQKVDMILDKLEGLSESFPQLLTKQEVADVLRVSVARINQLISSGKLETTSRVGNILISKEQLLKYLKSPSTKAKNFKNLKK